MSSLLQAPRIYLIAIQSAPVAKHVIDLRIASAPHFFYGILLVILALSLEPFRSF